MVEDARDMRTPAGYRLPALAVLACSLVLGFAHDAKADDATAAAKKNFVEGVQRFQRGDYQGAKWLFLKAEKQQHAAVTQYNLGRVEEVLGDVQEALEAYESYLAEVAEKGEFSSAAVIAIAQLKKRSVKLQVSTDPSGARLFIDGRGINGVTPITVLVLPGHHHVTVEKAETGWRDEGDVDADEQGKEFTVSFKAPERPKSSDQKVTAPEVRSPGMVVAAPVRLEPVEFVWGATFEPTLYNFFSSPVIHESSTGIAFGFSADIGYAITPRFKLMVHGFGAIGSDGVPPTYLFGFGPRVSFRVAEGLWLGAGIFGGRAYTCRGPGHCDDTTTVQGRKWDTNFVFGPQIEIAYTILTAPYGEWVLSVSPGLYISNAPPFLTTGSTDSDNHSLFIPVGFGLRSF